MSGDRYEVYGLDPIPTLLLSLGTTAFACLAVGLAVHYYYREMKGHEEQLLDAIWELCDAHGWRGDLGARLFRLLELERGDPIPDATTPATISAKQLNDAYTRRAGWTPTRTSNPGRHRKSRIIPDDLNDVFTDEE